MLRFVPYLLLVGVLLSAQEVKSVELSRYEVLAQVIQDHSIPNLVVVDVRSPDDYAQGHIPGAINIPWEKIFAEYPSNSAKAPIVVYGRPASADSRKAVDILRTRGYQNVFLFGSVSQWKGDLVQ